MVKLVVDRINELKRIIEEHGGKYNMLETMFFTIIKMSATASIAAVIIILLRLSVGRKLPKTFHYAAWVIVLIRLLVPFSVSSSFSIFNFIPLHSSEISQQEDGAKHEVIKVSQNVDNNNEVKAFHQEATVNGNGYTQVNVLDDETGSNDITDNMQSQNRNANVVPDNSINEYSIISIIALIWLALFLMLLIFCIYVYLKTSVKFKTAILFKDNGLVKECGNRINFKRKINIFTSEKIDTPVVAGITKVRIILPAFLVNKCDKNDLKYVITHELVHIKRHDNITKLLAVLALCLHWFNPLIWISFLLSQKDMEMSCDIEVLSAYKSDMRSQYAKSLLNIAVKQNALRYGGLLAFGESNIKDRINGIMKFKKSGVWLRIFAASMLIVLGIILLTDRQMDDTNKGKSAVANNKYLNDRQEINDENNKFSELKAHVAAMEELLLSNNFQYMTEDQIEKVLNTLPEIIRDNYHGVGRIESNGSGYILLTCKSGAKRLPEDTSGYEFGSSDTKLSQKVLEDSQGNEICRFSLGMYVNYYNDKDILFISVGDLSPNMRQIIQIETFHFSGYQEYIRFAKQAKERGNSIFDSGVYPQIAAAICIDGFNASEYIPIAETTAQDMKQKLDRLEKTSCDTSTLIQAGIAILFGEEDEKCYELCFLPDGTKVIHQYHERDKVIIDYDLYDSIMDIVKTRTAWEWVELSEIHDIVRAEMRMKFGRNSEEQVQIVEDGKSLKELEHLFSNAKYCGLTGCPFTAKLLLTRKDGKVITLQIATDSCDTMILGTSAGYDYGPEPRGPGIEGTVNRQEVLKRIFDKIDWESF